MLQQGYENQLGIQAHQQILEDSKLHIFKDPQEVDPVKRVAARNPSAKNQQSVSAKCAGPIHDTDEYGTW